MFSFFRADCGHTHGMNHHKCNYIFSFVLSFYFSMFVYTVGLSKLSRHAEELLMKELQGITRHLHWLIPFNCSYILLSSWIYKAVSYKEMVERIENFRILVIKLVYILHYLSNLTQSQPSLPRPSVIIAVTTSPFNISDWAYFWASFNKERHTAGSFLRSFNAFS